VPPFNNIISSRGGEEALRAEVSLLILREARGLCAPHSSFSLREARGLFAPRSLLRFVGGVYAQGGIPQVVYMPRVVYLRWCTARVRYT